MLKKFFFLFPFFTIIPIIYSFVCEENANHCLKCNVLTNLCIRCDLDIYAPDSKGGCSNSNHCQTGKNYCIECNEDENLCETCDIGYFPDENGGCSYTPNCLISYKGECLQCLENYILVGNNIEVENGFKFCKYNSSIDFNNCKKVNTSTGFCDECEKGYFLNLGDRRCTETENCFESIYGICSQCNPGFYLNKKEEECKRKEYPFILCKETLDGETCEKCDDDSFMAEDGQCVDSNFCSLSYKTKTSCKECKENYYLTKNKRACSDEKNCVNADKETGLCEICPEGNYLTKKRKCESNKEDNEFKYCKNAKEDYCTECEWGYYLGEDDQCTPSPNCTEAEEGVCVSCSDNFYLGKDNICTTVKHCAKSDFYKNCVECEEKYYFDLSDKTCKEAKDKFSNCLESTSLGERCLKCRNDYYMSAVDNLCYSNKEKGKFYKCAMSTMDGKECYQCIDGYYTGLKDNKCTKAYVCLHSDEDHICQECRYDYCLNKKDGKCYKNYEINNADERVYYKCLNTDDEGKVCKKCADDFEVGENGLCINLNDCEEEEEESCNKCKKRNYEDNLLCANKYFGCVETLAENCLRCDDLEDLNSCTECLEGYELDYNYECVKS
jgi:hypothetical protein